MSHDVFHADEFSTSASSECLIRRNELENSPSLISDKSSKLEGSPNLLSDSLYKPQLVPSIVLGTSFVKHLLITGFRDGLDHENPLHLPSSTSKVGLHSKLFIDVGLYIFRLEI